MAASGGDYEGKTAAVTVNVTDNDDAPVMESVSVQVSFSAAAHSVTEGGTVRDHHQPERRPGEAGQHPYDQD